MAKTATTTSKKKGKRQVLNGIVNILCKFNNTLVTITDVQGNCLAWNSAGASGFKGSRKSTPFAGRTAANDAAEKAINNYGLKEVEVRVTGPGPGREQAIRALHELGLKIKSIIDETSTPHNGRRPPKKRRV